MNALNWSEEILNLPSLKKSEELAAVRRQWVGGWGQVGRTGKGGRRNGNSNLCRTLSYYSKN